MNIEHASKEKNIKSVPSVLPQNIIQYILSFTLENLLDIGPVYTWRWGTPGR